MRNAVIQILQKLDNFKYKIQSSTDPEEIMYLIRAVIQCIKDASEENPIETEISVVKNKIIIINQLINEDSKLDSANMVDLVNTRMRISFSIVQLMLYYASEAGITDLYDVLNKK